MKWALPGLEHINRGFNAITGKESPHPVATLLYCDDNPDQSSKLNYVYRGNTYRIPLGVHVVTSPECSLDASTTIHSYTHGFSQSIASESELSLSASANIGVSFLKASASAAYSQSDSVKDAKELMSSGKTSLAVTTVKCLNFQFEWADNLDAKFGANYLHPDFERELNNMASIFDARTLVLKYGTHFYKRGYLGGKLESLTSIADTLLAEKGEKSVGTKISASISASISGGYGSFSGGLSADASVAQNGEVETTTDDEIANNTESKAIRSYGGAPFDPSTSTFGDWAKSVDALPVPIDFDLVEILTILPNYTNKHGLNVRDYWREATADYFEKNGVSYANKFSGYIFPPWGGYDGSEKTYGPYAYNLYTGDGTPLLVNPVLFTIPDTYVPHVFIADGDVMQINIPLEKTLLRDISFIQIFSMRQYMYQRNLADMVDSVYAMSAAPNTLDVKNWKIGNISIFDETAGMEYLFTRYENSGKYDGSENVYWFADTGYLMLADRWFYDIQLILVPISELPTPLCNSNSPFPERGRVIFDIVIQGDKKTITQTLDLPANYTTDGGLLSLQVRSTTDVGIVNKIEILPFWIDGKMCLKVKQVKVIDINNRVYFSTPFNPPAPFEFLVDGGSRGIFFDDRDYGHIMDEHWGFADTAYLPGTYSPFVAFVDAWSDVTTQDLVYAYQLNATLSSYFSAASSCNQVGGALAGAYHIQQLQERQVVYEAPSIWYESRISASSTYDGEVHYTIDGMCKDMTTTLYSDIGVDYSGYSPIPPLCRPLCIGPYPTPATLAHVGRSLINPIPLQLNFGVTVLTEIYDPGTNDSTSLGDSDNDPNTRSFPIIATKGYLHYQIVDVNDNFLKLSITNSTKPITAAAYYSSDWTGKNGSWNNMTFGGQWDPYWYGDGPVSFPVTIKISSASSQLTDALPYEVNTEIIGRVQF
eukprot:Phypoly_transcript_01911.p1 GENE.Phypoly_transcript_01911~~Phypoly_transcript_01911.p1  ORF type:complete len:934 (+),score=151.93 Phypoly_transcript_01911:205-3006(+)